MITSFKRLSLSAALALIAVAPPAQAWWGFGHYRIGVEVAKDPQFASVDPLYSMGPDTFKPYHIGLHENILPEFTWSHGVQAEQGDWGFPPAPTYPHDGRYPGHVMEILLRDKLSAATILELTSLTGHPPQTLGDPHQTARGFIVHNASDNVVHWDHFLGGENDSLPDHVCQHFYPLGDGYFLWKVNHSQKEEWSNYVLLMILDSIDSSGNPIQLFRGRGNDGCFGTADDIYSALRETDVNGNGIIDPSEDINGNGVLDAGEDLNDNGCLDIEDQNGNGVFDDYRSDVFDTVPSSDGELHLRSFILSTYPLDFKTNAPLQRLAMKAHRKNRRMSDVDSSDETESSEFVVKTSSEIRDSFVTHMNDGATCTQPGSQLACGELEAMTLDRFNELNVIASKTNGLSAPCGVDPWKPALLMVRFNLCVARAKDWLSNLGQ